MIFCPTCSNILLIEKTQTDFRFYCKTCPYIYTVTEKVTTKMDLERKQIDDVLGGQSAWANVDQTDADCTKCNNKRAFFMQV